MTTLDATGYYGANVSSPSLHPAGAIIKGLTDGTSGTTGNIGYIQDFTGGSQASGTGGYTYKISTTAASITNTPSVVVTTTLNKGFYLVCVNAKAYGASNTAIAGDIRVGGTLITSSGIGQNACTTSPGGSFSLVYPVIITADSTAVALYGSCSTGTITSAYTADMHVIRIA